MCLPRGTVPAPSHLCRSGVLASPCSGALSDSQGSPPHGSASSVVSAQSAAARAGSSRFHRGERFRRVRGPEVLRAFRQLRGVLRALTFSALGAPAEHRRGGKNRLIFNRRARPKRVQFVHVLVQACYPALAHFTQKTLKKVYSNRLFALRNACRTSLPLP